MHYSYIMPAASVRWSTPAAAIAAALRPTGQAHARQDRRWPIILRKLAALHKRGRRSIRIVHANCGAGELLMLAVRRAREIGFVAIEGRGVDGDALAIERARKASATARDPAIGLVFEVGGALQAMREEAEFPADLLLYACYEEDALTASAHAAGRTVLRASRTAG